MTLLFGLWATGRSISYFSPFPSPEQHLMLWWLLSKFPIKMNGKGSPKTNFALWQIIWNKARISLGICFRDWQQERSLADSMANSLQCTRSNQVTKTVEGLGLRSKLDEFSSVLWAMNVLQPQSQCQQQRQRDGRLTRLQFPKMPKGKGCPQHTDVQRSLDHPKLHMPGGHLCDVPRGQRQQGDHMDICSSRSLKD